MWVNINDLHIQMKNTRLICNVRTHISLNVRYIFDNIIYIFQRYIPKVHGNGYPKLLTTKFALWDTGAWKVGIKPGT